jgi:hypothetical protein
MCNNELMCKAGASETFKNPFQHNRHRNSDFVKEDWMNWKSVI